jgi:hypothetical protein
MVQAKQLQPTVVEAAERLVAIGDLHGDLDKAKAAFKLAGLTDDKGSWGGNTVCVQVCPSMGSVLELVCCFACWHGRLCVCRKGTALEYWFLSSSTEPEVP